jgi:hypothetical protein
VLFFPVYTESHPRPIPSLPNVAAATLFTRRGGFTLLVLTEEGSPEANLERPFPPFPFPAPTPYLPSRSRTRNPLIFIDILHSSHYTPGVSPPPKKKDARFVRSARLCGPNARRNLTLVRQLTAPVSAISRRKTRHIVSMVYALFTRKYLGGVKGKE